MCGIAGILALTEKGKDLLPGLAAASACLRDRGPDGEGLKTFATAALAHRRLAIIDPTSNASQPFTDESGRYTIVFNGEIFNFRELRSGLQSRGVSFRSDSDTEVLLQLYILEGESALQKLNGEFAFAVYDKSEDSLFVARDRFGVKPLYYYRSKDAFIFGSTLSAVTSFAIPRTIDQASLRLYLHLSYIPAPYTIYNEVRKMESATYIRISAKEFGTNEYFRIGTEQMVTDYNAALATLRQKLEAAVEARLVADVPLGAFLSGGLDSSVITAIAAKKISKLNTFSIGFPDEPFFDETAYAKLVAKRHKTEHTVFELRTNDLYENLQFILDALDEPFADSSALAVNLLCKLTRQSVKVALSGDGADELFGGYNKHAAELRARSGGLSSMMVRNAYPILRHLPKSRNSKAGNKVRQFQKFAEGIALDQKERYWRWAGFSPAGSLMRSEDLREFEERKQSILAGIGEDYNTVLKTDVELVLENDMLVKADRMSMSRGLEVRVPFLDHELVSFAFSLPAQFKIDRKSRKKILREAFAHELPSEILERPKKGFEVPLLNWFRKELRPMIEDDLLHDEFIVYQGLFDVARIRALKQELFGNNPNDAVAQVWALIVFQYWWKKNIGK